MHDLPARLRHYTHRFSALPFPVDGMLAPNRIYKSDLPGCGVFYSMITELGELVVVDAAGNRVQRPLRNLPLDASDVVGALIGRLERELAKRLAGL